MATLDTFFPGVLPDVPGCPVSTARYHIRKAVIDFCKESGIWRQDLDAIDLVDEQAAYPLPPVTGVQFRQVESVTPIIGSSTRSPLIHKTKRQLAIEYPGWPQWRSNVPLYYSTDVMAGQVVLTPVPAGMWEPSSIIVGVSMVPAEDAGAVPDFIAAQWRDAIEVGAKARILAMRGHPWSDPQTAAMLQHEFDVECDKATIVAIRESSGEGNQGLASRGFGDYIFNL